MRDAIKILLAAIAMAAMATYCALRMQVSADITHFLPGSEDRRLAGIARQLVDSTLTRTMIVSLQAPDEAAAALASRALAARLRADPEVEWLSNGPDSTVAESFYKLFFPHRYQLLSSDPERELPARYSAEGVGKSARALKEKLSSPMGALVKRLAGADPLLTFLEELKRLEEARKGPLDVRDGVYVTQDGSHAILFLATRSSPFAGAVQAPFLQRLQAAFAAVDASRTLKLETSGVNRFAVDTERLVRADINRVSIASTLALVALFLLLFRSPRILILSFVPIAFGMLTATTVGLLLYGKLHGLTLAFGSTLLGVCVDYPILYLNHHVLVPAPGGPWKTLRRIAPALLLGAFTTLAGFAGLAWTTFPGMREIAVFATTGILGALVSSCWLLPAAVKSSPDAAGLHRRLAGALGGALESLRSRRALLWLLPVAALIVCAVGLPRLRWADDLSALQRPNPAILAEDERVRARVSQMDSGRFVIALANTNAEALALNDRVWERLSAAKKAGALEDFRSVHDLLFSAGLQDRNARQLPTDLADRAARALEAEGFRSEGFAAFRQSLQSSPPPLGLDEVLASPLGDLLRPFRVQLGNEVGLLSFVRGVRDPAAFASGLADLEGVRSFDQGAFLASAYGRYRARAQQLSIAGIVFVFALMLASYRDLRKAVAVAVPAVLAAATALAVLALFGVETNLLHLVSLLLVLSIGEDYAIFLVASVRSRDELAASAMSVTLCCLSAMLSFGLLALSEIPALRAIGLTTGLGVLLSFVLAPAALALLPPQPGEPNRKGAP